MSTISTRKLQHEFLHARDFGVIGSWNKVNGTLFEKAIREHIRDAPQQIIGTYRGRILVTHHFDPGTNLWTAVDQSGNFVAGWKLSPEQVQYLLTKGNVQ